MANCVPNLDDWLPMSEAISQTRMSQRTIYRMVAEGKLRQDSRPIPGRRPLPVFDPAGVAELARSTLKANPEIMPALAESRQNLAAQLPPMEFWVALVEAIQARPQALLPAAESAESLARLKEQVLVTRQDAKMLGFSPAILRHACKIGKIEKLPGARYRMRELLAL